MSKAILFDKIRAVNRQVELIVVIPAYKESFEQLAQTIVSLNACGGDTSAAIFILINYKETDIEDIQLASIKLQNDLYDFIEKTDSHLHFEVFLEALTGKKSGVGLARKMLMDAAFLQFQEWGTNGIIVNLDADTLVENNYLRTVKTYFEDTPEVEAASIAFHHPISSIKEDDQNKAIINYELHLRYFINMQRWVGLPYAYQTVGSAMAVRSDAYAKEGGMNVKQAGEDFYFLQKYAKNWTLGEINKTVVYPSDRSSDRVPFGTGKAVNDYLVNGKHYITSYNPQSFIALKAWLERTELFLYTSPLAEVLPPEDELLVDFLKASSIDEALKSIIGNSTPGLSRVKQFYNWFDAFKLFKYLHFCRDAGRKDLPIHACLETLFELIEDLTVSENSSKNDTTYLQESLKCIRAFDLKSDYNNQWRAALISRLSNT